MTMGLLPDEKKALKELKIALAENHQLLDFRVFGSKARGTDVKDSDLDVMIVLEEHSPKIESCIDDLIFDINLKYDCFITAIFFSRNELEAGPMSESPIYKKIMTEGISL
jgi:DNA polymerase sigma